MIDIDKLTARLGGNITIVDKVLELFATQYGGQDSLFDPLISKSDTEAIYQLAHSMKGALANICAEEDAELASQIEAIARAGAMPEQSLFDSFEQNVKDINTQIKQHFS